MLLYVSFCSLADASSETEGNSAARAPFDRAIAALRRACACAIDGELASASSINWSSCGSPKDFHHACVGHSPKGAPRLLSAASPSLDAGFSIGPRSGREAHAASTAPQIATAAALRHAAEDFYTKEEIWRSAIP